MGLRQTVSYEAQAAIELERVAGLERVAASRAWRPGPAGPDRSAAAGGCRFVTDGDQIDPAPVLRGIVDDWRHGLPGGRHRGRVPPGRGPPHRRHRQPAAGPDGDRPVALSGGVFQNVLLVGLVRAELADRQLTVLTHRVVPPNDGGLALGQAAIAGRPDRERATGWSGRG